MSLNLMQHAVLTAKQMFSAQSVCYKNTIDRFKGIKVTAVFILWLILKFYTF